MFPGAHSSVYYNDEGEVLGWDRCDSVYDDPYDPDQYLDYGDYEPEEGSDEDGEADQDTETQAEEAHLAEGDVT